MPSLTVKIGSCSPDQPHRAQSCFEHDQVGLRLRPQPSLPNGVDHPELQLQISEEAQDPIRAEPEAVEESMTREKVQNLIRAELALVEESMTKAEVQDLIRAEFALLEESITRGIVGRLRMAGSWEESVGSAEVESTRANAIGPRDARRNDLRNGNVYGNIGQSRDSPRSLLPMMSSSCGSGFATQSLFSIDTEVAKQAILRYKMHASMWDASMFIGAPRLGRGISSELMVYLIFNLLLVAMFVAVIKAEITEPEFDDSSVAELQFWRATIAHDVSLRNPITGESLASGVCNQKLSTPFSNGQIFILSALDKYLAGFIWDSVCTGGMMCALCLSVWLMTLIEEIRSIFAMFLACRGLPTQSECCIEECGERFRLAGTTTCKKYMMFLLCTVRMGIVAVLAWYGFWFLVFEVSIEEILLNALSLNLILNIDELMFSSLAPKVTQTLIDRMLPLPLPWYAPVLEFAVLPLLIIVPLVLVAIYLLGPNIKVLRDAREALCGGVGSSLDFVVAVDAIGIPWAASTPTSNSAISSFAAHAVLQAQNHGFPPFALQTKQRANNGSFMYASTGDELQTFQSTLSEFRQPKDWKMVHVTDLVVVHVVGWNELSLLGPADGNFGDQNGTVYNRYLRYLLGRPATAQTTCAQVPVSHCNKLGRTLDAVVMRQLCPSRCGCDEPTRGTVGSFVTMGLEFSVSGCAPWNLRKQKFQNALAVLPCKDTVARDNFASWALGLGGTSLAPNSSLQDRILASFDRGGCPEAVRIFGSEPRICEETSIPSICPESCGCNTSWTHTFYHAREHYFCPRSCKSAKEFCFTVARNYSLDLSASTTGPFVGYACVFPFKYEGQEYTSCTLHDWVVPWCAVTVKDGVTYHWGDCPDNCSSSGD